MFLSQNITALHKWLGIQRAAGRPIGFAPTMGALHEGHLELIRMAKNAGQEAVASIFVNPTQFNDPKDLEKYPRTPGRDLEMLHAAGCDAVFMPTVEEVYPPGVDLRVQLDFGSLDKVMEGEFRPGHFAGMATVVKRLVDIVRPQSLYMGQKDYQQFSIVRDMIRQLGLPVELVMCPTVREADGLAMSSRNVRLTPEMRAKAPAIYRILQNTRDQLGHKPVAELESEALEQLAAEGFKPEYFKISDGITLLPLHNTADSRIIAICAAVWAGEVRLIDNVVLEG